MKKVLNYLKQNVTFGKVTRTTLVLLLTLTMFNCSKDESPSENNETLEEVCGTKSGDEQTEVSVNGVYRYYIYIIDEGDLNRYEIYRVSREEYEMYKNRDGDFICITPLER